MASDIERRFIKPVNPQTDSLFFSKLPAELRNKIYKLVHSSEDDSTVDLEAVQPPTKSFPLACQRAHAESYALFRAAFIDY